MVTDGNLDFEKDDALRMLGDPAQYMLQIFVDFDHVKWDVVMRRLIDSACREASFFSGRSASLVSRYGEVTVLVTRGQDPSAVQLFGTL